jgi:hypothetical protein
MVVTLAVRQPMAAKYWIRRDGGTNMLTRVEGLTSSSSGRAMLSAATYAACELCQYLSE